MHFVVKLSLHVCFVLFDFQIASMILLIERRIPTKLRVRTGFPGCEIGLDGDDRWYLRVQETVKTVLEYVPDHRLDSFDRSLDTLSQASTSTTVRNWTNRKSVLWRMNSASPYHRRRHGMSGSMDPTLDYSHPGEPTPLSMKRRNFGSGLAYGADTLPPSAPRGNGAAAHCPRPNHLEVQPDSEEEGEVEDTKHMAVWDDEACSLITAVMSVSQENTVNDQLRNFKL